MPGSAISIQVPPGEILQRYTFHVEPREMKFEVVYGRKEDLYMQYKLLGHPDGFQVLSIADLA
jgi:hypothetical protein